MTWTGPVEIPELAWQYEADGTTVSIADVTPGWHKPSVKLIAIGIKVRYSKEGKQLNVFINPKSSIGEGRSLTKEAKIRYI